MFTYLEINRIDPNYRWLELLCADTANEGEEVVRISILDDQRVTDDFLKRYMAKRANVFEPPRPQIVQIGELFQEAFMASETARTGNRESDLVVLLPTTTIDFRYPEKSSFRKSKAARVQIFTDDAYQAIHARHFEKAMKRLNWIHEIDPANLDAFGLKIVTLRSWKKMAECVPVFEAWIDAYPDHVEPFLGLNEMWLFLDQNQRAKDGFESLLEREPANCPALIGLAQAKLKLGEDPLPDLRKAWILNGSLTKMVIENDFDFRSRQPNPLIAKSLKEIADQFRVPLNRVLERAQKGVLPMHPPEGDGLIRFYQPDLDRHYEVLKMLGLEIAQTPGPNPKPIREEPEIIQPGLFDD